MASLQFYYNYATRKSERTLFFETPSLWKNALTMYIVSDAYVFEEEHINIDLQPYVIASSLLSSVKHMVMPNTSNHIIDIGNTDFPFRVNSTGKVIGSLVIANNSKPICIIRDLEDMPAVVYGQYLTINFAQSFIKAFSFNLTAEEVGNSLLHQHFKSSLQAPKNDISRAPNHLTLGELLDKSSIGGKAAAYKDLSLSGKSHPLTGDLVTVNGVNAINQSLRTIILSNTYDRPFSSQDIAGNINSFLFDFADDITNSELKTGIAIAIGNNEPRINIIDIFAQSSPESYTLKVMILYSIKMTNTVQEFSIILDRA